MRERRFASETLPILLVLGVLAAFSTGPCLAAAADRAEADRLFREGYALYQQQDYAGAQASWGQAVGIFRKLGLEKDTARTLSNLGGVALALGEHGQALGYYEQALVVFRKLGSEEEVAATFYNLGGVAADLAQYDQAIDYYEQALAAYRKLGLEAEAGRTLTVIGMAARELAQYDEALGYYEEALAIFRKMRMDQEAAATLSLMGYAAADSAQYHRAVGYHEQALVTYRRLGLEGVVADTLANLGELAAVLSQYEKAIGYYEEALATYRRLGQAKGTADTLNKLGAVARDLARHDQALDYFEQALAIYRKLGLEEEAAITLGNMGVVTSDFAEYDKAVSYCEQALSSLDKLGADGEAAHVLNTLGGVALDLGQYDQALSYLERALAIRRKLGSERKAGETINNLGLAAAGLGRYDQALGHLDQALATYRKLGLEKEAASVLINLGVMASDLAQRDKALGYQQQALATLRKLGLEKEAAVALICLGNLADDVEQYDEALSYFGQAAAAFGKLGVQREVRRAEFNVADVRMRQGRLAEARAALGRWDADPLRWGRYYLLAGQPAEAAARFADAAEGAGEGFGGRVASQIGLGLAHEALGEWEASATAYGKAVELIEQARSRTPPTERGSFLEGNAYCFRRLEAYEGLVRVLHRVGKDDEAFLWSEHTKARVLVEALARVPYGTPVGLPANLRKQEDDLTNRVAALSKQLEEKPELRATIEPQLKPLQEALDALISRLRREYPEYASLRYPQPLPASELALRPGEVLLAYEVTEPETLAFLVRGGKVEGTFEIKITRAELAKLVGQYRQGYEQVAGVADLPRVDLGVSHRLYELLLKDPLGQVKPGEQVAVVPDEAIGLVPLEGLATSLPVQLTWKDGEHGPTAVGVRYVGDDYTFSYWQSGTSLTTVRRLHKGGGGEKVLVVADPVFDVADARVSGTAIAQASGTEEGQFNLMREVRDDLTASYGQLVFRRLAITGSLPERLRAAYGDKLTAWVGLEARESKLKREPLEGYGEVIFSTHGVLDESVSWLQQPALVLSLVGNEEGEDGYLTMAEVMDLKLGAEVVGLMACDSGAGRVTSGEGVMGMGRAFQYAGARSVLASLWSVEDESTNLLAETFLQAVKEGQDKATALASARQALRRAGYDHPFYWAAFVLVGER